MPFNLLLLPLLGGFILITRAYRFRYRSVRLDGYRLLIHSSLAGLSLLVCAQLLVVLLRARLDWIDAAFHQAVHYDGAGVATLAFLLGLPIAWLSNQFFQRDAEIDRVIDNKGDPLELILRKSLKETKAVLLSVKSGKVYVGFVISKSSPEVSVDWIKILPMVSGYREGDTKRVVFTTNYKAVFRMKLEDDSAVSDTFFSDFELVIPFREIESVSIFDAEVYKIFYALPKEDALSNKNT